MKNAMKVFALTLCLVMMVSVFTACGDVSGEYAYSSTIFGVTTTTTYKFSLFGNDVTKTVTSGDTTKTTEYTYELNEEGDEITFYNTDGEKEATWNFEQGDDYIKMGLATGIGDLGMLTYDKQ